MMLRNEPVLHPPTSIRFLADVAQQHNDTRERSAAPRGAIYHGIVGHIAMECIPASRRVMRIGNCHHSVHQAATDTTTLGGSSHHDLQLCSIRHKGVSRQELGEAHKSQNEPPGMSVLKLFIWVLLDCDNERKLLLPRFVNVLAHFICSDRFWVESIPGASNVRIINARQPFGIYRHCMAKRNKHLGLNPVCLTLQYGDSFLCGVHALVAVWKIRIWTCVVRMLLEDISQRDPCTCVNIQVPTPVACGGRVFKTSVRVDASNPFLHSLILKSFSNLHLGQTVGLG